MLQERIIIISARWKFREFIGFCILFCFIQSGSAQSFEKLPEPWREEYDISLENFSFDHPMSVINSAELIIINGRIRNSIEPQVTCFNILLVEAEKQLEFVSNAPDSMHIMGGYEHNSNLGEMREWLDETSHAAYCNALAYCYSGKLKYASKALEIIMDWANTFTTFTGDDRGLQLGSYFSQLLYAADLIWNYTEFSITDKDQLKKWIEIKWLNEGDLLEVMRSRDNNWKDAGILGCLCSSIILEDTTLLKECLVQMTSYFYTRTDIYVKHSGPDWKIKKDQVWSYLPAEVTRNDGNSGLTYTAYSLTLWTQCLEIARYAGFDFWHSHTEENATILEVIQQYFNWDIMEEAFPWNDEPNRTSARRNCYELANTHFEVDAQMKNWIKMNRPLDGGSGDEYISLNKGEPIEANLKDQGVFINQNFPNPFKLTTTIHFTITTGTNATLYIYNNLGGKVEELINGWLETGIYSITFDAINLTSGAYHCILKTDFNYDYMTILYME